jgi:hypothetical protein
MSLEQPGVAESDDDPTADASAAIPEDRSDAHDDERPQPASDEPEPGPESAPFAPVQRPLFDRDLERARDLLPRLAPSTPLEQMPDPTEPSPTPEPSPLPSPTPMPDPRPEPQPAPIPTPTPAPTPSPTPVPEPPPEPLPAPLPTPPTPEPPPAPITQEPATVPASPFGRLLQPEAEVADAEPVAAHVSMAAPPAQREVGPRGEPEPVTAPVAMAAPMPEPDPEPATEAPASPGPSVESRSRRSHKAERPRARKVRRIIRHLDPWSVLKVSLLFYLTLFLIVLTAGVLLWGLGRSTGTVKSAESFVTSLGFGNCEVDPNAAASTSTAPSAPTADGECGAGQVLVGGFKFEGGTLFKGFALAGLVLVIAGAGANTALALLFNVISELTGGVRVTVLEEEPVRRRSGSPG